MLEGEPGCGKSVALRRLAIDQLGRAQRSRRLRQVVPLYVNLKEFRPPQSADAEAVESHILQTLLTGCTVDEAKYLKEQFQAGLGSGTWLFLFDSFDEIPAVLSQAEYEDTVRDTRWRSPTS